MTSLPGELIPPVPAAAPAERGLLLRTLGRSEVVTIAPDGGEVVVSRGGKPVALLAYLAAAPRRSATRDALVSMFWPTASAERGRHALRQQLVNLRKLLGADAIVTTDERVMLVATVMDDRSQLLAAVRAGDAAEVLRLDGGDYLPDLGAASGIDLQQWRDAERRALRQHLHWATREHVPSLIEAGHRDEAIAIAGRLRDRDPDDDRGWSVLLETLVGTGRLLDARVEAEALEGRLHADEREPEAALASAIRRLRSASPTEVGRTPVGDIADSAPLVGRDDVLGRLLSRWRHASNGRSEVVAVVGAAGIGKTRLLVELCRHLQADGARVVRVGAHLGERTMAHALTGDLALRLGQLSGAGGVGPATAEILVALAPALSSQFRSATADRAGATDALRTAHAMSELVQCVADERPLALVVDDWHWADQASREALEGMVRRLADICVLVVLAGRPPEELLIGRRHHRVDLAPLTVGDVRAMLGELAELSDWTEAAATKLAELVHGAGRGVPLLMLHFLRHARDHGWLALDGGWRVLDADALRAAASAEATLAARVTGLEPRALAVLQLVATDGVLVTGDVLARASGYDDVVLDTVITTLEQLGFAERVDGAWRPAHDEVATISLAQLSAEKQVALRRALGEAYAAAAGDDATRWRRAADHLLSARADDRLVALLRQWLARQRAAGARPSRHDVAALVGDAVPTALIARALSSRRSRNGMRVLVTAVAVAAVIIGAREARSGPVGAPTHLELSDVPLMLDGEALARPITATLLDARGEAVRVTGDSVRAAVVTGGRVVRGSSAPIVNGRAEFRDLRVDGDVAVRLRFSAPHMTPVVSDSIFTSSADLASSLRLSAATLSGIALGPDSLVLRVAPGQRITGTVDVRYTSAWQSASMVLVAATTWRDGPASCHRLRSLMTPVRDAGHRVALDIDGPARAGSYYLIVAFQAEDTAEHVCSGTNWTYGAPMWHDGNDLSGWGARQAAEALRYGRVGNGFLSVNPDGSVRRSHYTVPAAMVRVEVGP